MIGLLRKRRRGSRGDEGRKSYRQRWSLPDVNKIFDAGRNLQLKLSPKGAFKQQEAFVS